MTEKEYVYVAIGINDQTNVFEGVKVFKTEEDANSYIRNRRAFVRKMEVQ